MLLLLLLLLFSTLNFLKSDKIKKPLLRRTFFGFRSRLFRGSSFGFRSRLFRGSSGFSSSGFSSSGSGFLLLSLGFRGRLRLGFRLESLLLGLRLCLDLRLDSRRLRRRGFLLGNQRVLLHLPSAQSFFFRNKSTL